ncbi:MAG: chemotaxis protein CheX [Clostridiales bacterium]|jgi:chemotaxis protein CheX|nr:chemotaxis protein CheX [Eubacteriales bacterium]MDH7567129.1 chemotaxis protein CheX [Clostridiales bacterium]
MNVEYINPFIEASQTVLKSIANIDSSIGKVYLRTSSYSSDTLAIVIGLIGDIRGQIIFSMNRAVACKIASAMMMGMPVYELDEVSKSAVAEAANMILGNAATLLYRKGVKTDITPPSLFMGDDMQVFSPKMKTICVPLNISSNETIELDIAAVE